MFGSCLLITIVAALYEGLKVVRDCLLQKACSTTCNGDALAVPTNDIPAAVETVKLSNRCVRQVNFSVQNCGSGHICIIPKQLMYSVVLSSVKICL